MEREESTAVTLTRRDERGGRYTARIEGGVVDIQVQNVESFASLRVPLSELAVFSEFIGAVLDDPASSVVESDPTPTDPEEVVENG